MKRMFHQNKLNPGDCETLAELSRNYIVPQKFVKDYVDHLAQIEMRKRREELKVEGSKRSEWLEQDYNGIESEELHNSDQISSLKVHEPNCTWFVMGSCLSGNSQRKWHI